jgi:hypothetical protein
MFRLLALRQLRCLCCAPMSAGVVNRPSCERADDRAEAAPLGELADSQCFHRKLLEFRIASINPGPGTRVKHWVVNADSQTPCERRAGALHSHSPTGETRGKLKALIGEDDRILGFTAFGPRAGELLPPVQIAMRTGLP